MKKIRILSFALVLVLLLGLLAGCADSKPAPKPTEDPASKYPKLEGQVVKNDKYTENALYLWNDITDRKVYCYEVIPASYVEGQKLPIIIYVHGNNGTVNALSSEPHRLAQYGIAGFTFECCGGNKVSPKSDGKELSPSHYSSRATDLETVLAYVKTLPYVDPDRIFLYGQSYGGIVVMSTAPRHNDDVAGIILESTGVKLGGDGAESGGMFTASGNGEVEEYKVPADWQTYLKGWKGDVLLCNSEGDALVQNGSGEGTVQLYQDRGVDAAVKYVLCPGGDHAFNSFSEEGQAMTLEAMREMVVATAK